MNEGELLLLLFMAFVAAATWVCIRWSARNRVRRWEQEDEITAEVQEELNRLERIRRAGRVAPATPTPARVSVPLPYVPPTPRARPARYEVCMIEADGSKTIWGQYALKRDAQREAKLAAARWYPHPTWLVRLKDEDGVRIQVPKRHLRYSEPDEANEVRDEEEI